MYYLIDELYRVPSPNSEAYLDAHSFDETGLRHNVAEAYAMRFLDEIDPLPSLEMISITTNWFEDFISWITIKDLMEIISREPDLSVFINKGKALKYLATNSQIIMSELYEET